MEKISPINFDPTNACTYQLSLLHHCTLVLLYHIYYVNFSYSNLILIKFQVLSLSHAYYVRHISSLSHFHCDFIFKNVSYHLKWAYNMHFKFLYNFITKSPSSSLFITTVFILASLWLYTAVSVYVHQAHHA